MSVRANTERLAAARAAEDGETIAALLADDVVLHVPVSLGVDPVQGRETVATVLGGAVAKTYLQAETIRRDVLQTVVDGDVSVVRSRLSGVTLDGDDYANDYVCLYTWRDGLVARVEEHMDTLHVAQSGVAKLAQTDGGGTR